MSFFMQTDLSLYTAILLLLLLFGQAASYEAHLFTHRLFRGMVFLTLVILLLDTIGWSLENQPTPVFILLNWVTSVLGCLLSPVTGLFWFLYAYSHVLSGDRRPQRVILPAALPVLVYAPLALSAPFNGLLFFIDDQNRFHRGSLFLIMATIMVGYLLAAFVFLLKVRTRIAHKDAMPLFAFMLPPLIFGLIQVLFYGTTLVWSGMALSLLILHLYLQHHSLRTDYLTGLYNRRQLDRHIRSRIEAWHPGMQLGALMLDIDNFKAINDTCGHAMGDDALEELANILRKGFHRSDFIARYAGDEFVVVLSAKTSSNFSDIRRRLADTLERFNSSSGKPYRLDISIGCALYDLTRHKTGDQFLHAIDTHMYHEKRRRRVGISRNAALAARTIADLADGEKLPT